MNEIELRSYAKINLTLDVKGVLENGMHIVEMVMQQILLCDDVSMKWEPSENAEGLEIRLTTNRRYLPTDEKNLAYKAALLMDGKYGPNKGVLTIHIKKRIPVAAGLAGGSSNGATVLHGLNLLWGLDLSLAELCEAGSELGSDVPFCVMGQAAENINLKERFAGDPLATHCALATGTGTELKPIEGLRSHLVLSKPPVSVSTASVYKGIDSIDIPKRPDNQAMIEALKTKDLSQIEENMVNVLENYTLKEYSTVVYTKNKMQKLCEPRAVLMSGSGPTVFGLCDSIEQSQGICEKMMEENKESYWTRTTC
ncbi:MAG: 4-(cytidine 5'-diphospho)-2-C-methyl-D-erythritol kinase [Bacillota bacterium]|nr:4-(cytidine 5'-diphospho)-2-C-methyl-D-erythritol kinase [Bacillota bacterium]